MMTIRIAFPIEISTIVLTTVLLHIFQPDRPAVDGEQMKQFEVAGKEIYGFSRLRGVAENVINLFE